MVFSFFKQKYLLSTDDKLMSNSLFGNNKFTLMQQRRLNKRVREKMKCFYKTCRVSSSGSNFVNVFTERSRKRKEDKCENVNEPIKQHSLTISKRLCLSSPNRVESKTIGSHRCMYIYREREKGVILFVSLRSKVPYLCVSTVTRRKRKHELRGIKGVAQSLIMHCEGY